MLAAEPPPPRNDLIIHHGNGGGRSPEANKSKLEKKSYQFLDGARMLWLWTW